MGKDISQGLAEQVRQAYESRRALAIRGSGSKSFLGEPRGEPLEVGAHTGIVDYQPSELVITARAGTPLTEIEATLASAGQTLPFEPPHFGDDATLGGTIALGLSGPSRPYVGSARDFVLGTRIINGKGEVLKFGGQVMKNVAGYDVSRLMTGAMGTLGVILEVSLKVLPQPATRLTLVNEMSQGQAITLMNALAGKPLPLSAACWTQQCCYVRLSGAERAVAQARDYVGGDEVTKADEFWRGLREHTLPFFLSDAPLWRLSVPPTTKPMDIPGDYLVDWGGAQRWLHTQADAQPIRTETQIEGGHAMRFRGGSGERHHPLPDALQALHRRVKSAFDPANILNPALLYSTL